MKIVTIVLVVFCFTMSSAQVIPSENIVLHLSFDGNELVDLSDNQHSVIDHQTSFGTGINNEGLLLDGENNYLEIPYNSALEIPSQLSISQWYQHQEQDGTGFYSLVEQSANEFGGHSRYGTWVFNGNLVMSCIEPDQCPNGSTLCQRCIISETILEPGQWYHIVSTYDGSSQKLYINGVLDSEETYNTVPTGISVRPYPLTIGTDMYDARPLYLRGTLDEILITNIALSVSQVSELYDAFRISATTEKKEQSYLHIYPNPTSDYLTYEAPFKINEIQLRDFTGKIIRVVEEITGRLYIVDLPEGSYTFSVLGDSNQLHQKLSIVR